MNAALEKQGKPLPVVLAVLLFYFNKKVRPLYHPDQGRDMLIIAIVFEIIRLGIFFYKSNLDYQNILSTGITAVVLLGMIFLVTRFFQIKLKDIGLNNLQQWNRYEIIYFVLMVPIAIGIFYYFTQEKFNTSLQENGWSIMIITFVFYLCWGFYQEWIYRGFIQTELTRRYNATIAIILANIVFTFGPLHFYHLYHGNYLIVAATFAIGLIFGFLYHRSYNLWIIGILHGIGTWFLVGLP